ncbi:hypothetical protein PISMIDRAFT_671279 [Pisolithus microcarpus 441]|uniref:Uncharacterized protein n=1 Tax=Pisolithus microcarpus 441 TaxID=765257 RepID=A0A0C9ZL83_9AGAM|nr:hypothetical protein PISMIDRAFT_671279 [Pisolithus microcarpus 441]
MTCSNSSLSLHSSPQSCTDMQRTPTRPRIQFHFARRVLTIVGTGTLIIAHTKAAA